MYVVQGSRPLVVILPPKTATRTYHKLLMSIRDRVTRLGNRHSVPKDHLFQYADAGDPIFMAVRHPADTIVSWYHYVTDGRDRPPEFAEYLDEFLKYGNVPWVTPDGPLFDAHGVETGLLRYESGPVAELTRALKIIGVSLPEQEEPFIGAAANRQPWRSYYTEDAIHRTYDRFTSDFDKYGYEV